MSKETIIGLLRKGKNGNEILMILDNIIPDSEDDDQPTLNEIQF